MLHHPTLEKLQQLRLLGMSTALRASRASFPTSTSSASRSASAYSWTGN
jgi:hypothetical protein